MSNRRIVQVFVIDPNENVPLANAIVYQDENPRLTDLTDQELYFELDLKTKLEAHNAERVKFRDKRESDRSAKDVMLPPAQIRDLKVFVSLVAKF